MNTDEFITENFDTAHKIHEQCDKLNLSTDKARLFTYIHFRLFANGEVKTPEDIDHSEIAEVIDFMQDKQQIETTLPESICYAEVIRMPKKLKSLDNRIRHNYGMELRIHSELNNRSRFHRDEEFRERIIEVYRNKIVPYLKGEKIKK